MRYGVTGESYELNARESRYVIWRLEQLLDVTETVSGGAHGVDTLFFQTMAGMWPDATHRLCVPQAPFNDQLLQHPAANNVEVAHNGPTFGARYMARNDLLIRRLEGGALLAFPETGVEARRSGTWATVRRARKAGIPVQIYPLAEGVLFHG